MIMTFCHFSWEVGSINWVATNTKCFQDVYLAPFLGYFDGSFHDPHIIIIII